MMGRLFLPVDEMTGIRRSACVSLNVTGFRARFALLVSSFGKTSKPVAQANHNSLRF